MTSYRRMRRQARRVRRSGVQPMMVISSGDQFPEPAGLVILRLGMALPLRTRPRLPRQRDPRRQLVAARGPPALVAVHRRHRRRSRRGTGGIRRHDRHPGVDGTPVRGHDHGSQSVPGLPPRPRWGRSSRRFRRPWPSGGLVLSVPWWAHRRRRAKVRVERKLEAWPEIAQAVGLAGSQVMSAVVDVWGWRVRLRLARGQTIADVIAQDSRRSSPAWAPSAARCASSPTPDDLANRCELRVLDSDPHADAVPWPGPSVTSITEPIDLGPFEDAAPCRVLFLRRHALGGGATGSGKSGWLNVLMGNLVACRDVVIWAIDLKKGMELGPWALVHRTARHHARRRPRALLADAVAILRSPRRTARRVRPARLGAIAGHARAGHHHR